MALFEAGKSGNPNGRPKGVPNKSTVVAKEAFSQAFEGLGGAQALMDWALENPTEFFKLYSKLIPMDVKADLSGKIEVQWKAAE